MQAKFHLPVQGADGAEFVNPDGFVQDVESRCKTRNIAYSLGPQKGIFLGGGEIPESRGAKQRANNPCQPPVNEPRPFRFIRSGG